MLAGGVIVALYMGIQECMQTRAATQLSAHRSRRAPGLAIMRRLALGLALPSFAEGHPSSGGAPQQGGGAFLQQHSCRTFLFAYDGSIYKYDHSAILDLIVNGSADAAPRDLDLLGAADVATHVQSDPLKQHSSVRPYVEDACSYLAAGAA